MFPLKRTALILALLPAPLLAQSSDTIDFPTAFLEQATRLEGSEAASLTDEFTARLLLADPSSIYSELNGPPAPGANAAWDSALTISGRTPEQALVEYARRMGYTKARPNIDVAIHRSYIDMDPLIAAGASKAAVDRDIFKAALDRFNYSKGALAANYAVAAQILRDTAAQVDVSRHEELNIRTDVLDRFLNLSPALDLDDYDAGYLQELLHTETLHPAEGRSSSFSAPLIPVQFRVARLAAAYHDASGYFTAPPCLKNGGGAHDPMWGRQGDDEQRTPCFADATDQAVYAWYLVQFRAQMNGEKRYPDKRYENKLLELLRPIAIIAEAAGVVSFIRFSIGMKSFSRGGIRSAPMRGMYRKVNQLKCRL